MSTPDQFRQTIEEGYTFEGPSFTLGGAMLGEETFTNSLVRIPLGTLNRHGLIAGATGTGKTKTLQIIAEQLSREGVPSLLMDIKGDLSGIAVASGGHPKIDERHEAIGIPFTAGASPVELLTLSNEPGARLRATVVEFGPVLFSKMLDLNDTQSGIANSWPKSTLPSPKKETWTGQNWSSSLMRPTSSLRKQPMRSWTS